MEEIKHGDRPGRTGYNRGCRCHICRTAKAAQDAEAYLRRKARKKGRAVLGTVVFPKCHWREDITAPIRTVDDPYGEGGQVFPGSVGDDIYSGATSPRGGGFSGTRIA